MRGIATLPIVIVIVILLVIVGGIFMFSRNSGSDPKSSPNADVKSSPGKITENPNAKSPDCKEYDFKAELGNLKITVDATASVKVSRKVEACLGVDPGFPITQTARAGKSVEFPPKLFDETAQRIVW